MVAMALISGVTPRRTDENIFIGSVVDPGPEAKLAITRSSSDRVKLSSHPAATAGAISGRVMRKNTVAGLAPRSCAASSTEVSKPASRDCTTTAT
jgi:hypothetical protein